jgi:aurora kinase
MASIGEESKSSNPEYGGFNIKNRKLINLSKNKSEIKLGLHGTNIDDFEIGKKLGKGNFGDVYLVRHTILGFIFALKIISKNVVR